MSSKASQAMRKYLLKHTLKMVQFQSTAEMKDRIDETLVELESENHFLH
jgi:hypothetical protein